MFNKNYKNLRVHWYYKIKHMFLSIIFYTLIIRKYRRGKKTIPSYAVHAAGLRNTTESLASAYPKDIKWLPFLLRQEVLSSERLTKREKEEILNEEVPVIYAERKDIGEQDYAEVFVPSVWYSELW